MRRWALLVRLVIAPVAGAAMIATSAEAEEFYRGKSLEIIVGGSPGGGYDIYSRAIAKYLPKHIPGHPNIVVRNMPGAGGARSAAYLFKAAANDGLTVLASTPGAIVGPILGEGTQDYDPTKFAYLGSADSGSLICATYASSKFKTFEQALIGTPIFGASGAGGTTRDYALMQSKAAGATFKVVAGYKGTAEIILAMERGEIDGMCGWPWPTVKSQKPDWLRDGKLNILVQINVEDDSELSKLGVPGFAKFTKSEADRRAVALVVSQQVFGRPYLLPPGTPAARVSMLRAALAATLNDPAFLSEAQVSRLDVSPASGEKVQELVSHIYAAPAETIARARDLIKP
jgi:tripartite-type tricarboxylate transporter receptor subunit TctC